MYGFVNGEKTAITTIPPISSPVGIYIPQTPTPIAILPSTPSTGTAILTWDSSFSALFQAKCGACHGTTVKLAQLSFSTYADALKGGQDGFVILAGNPSGSLLI